MVRQIRRAGLTWTEILIVVLVLVGVLVVLPPGFSREQMHKNTRACWDNLRVIGSAMATYAHEYDGVFPVAGGRGTKWGSELRNWLAATRQEAFGVDPNGGGGQATIGSSLYLRVRQVEVAPRTFVCRVDKGTKEFRAESYGLNRNHAATLWDFGPDPARHCSYAYQMVYNGQKLTTAGEPGFAIAADRNPWIDSPFAAANSFADFVPDFRRFGGTSEQARCGNVVAHKSVGQNVLFLDAHVEFELRPYCGLEDDNIYTAWDGQNKIRGAAPKLGSLPADKLDSLLVNDPPVRRR